MKKQTNEIRKAIPTQYKGIQFKSRLEAQCAYLLDCFGWDWAYEPTSYMLPNGVSFTPDFVLVDRGIIIECRGYESKKGNRQITGMATMLTDDFEIEGSTVDTLLVIYGDKQPILFTGQRPGFMAAVIHCRECGWHPLKREPSKRASLELYCPSCISPIYRISPKGWDGSALVDAVAIVTVRKGSILVNGHPATDGWNWISSLTKESDAGRSNN